MAHAGRQNADEALALALVSGKTLRDAAAEVGVSERTARRRWASAKFRRRVCLLRGEMVNRALSLLADGMSEASQRLRELVKSQNEMVALNAARALLAEGGKLWAKADVDMLTDLRLTKVEERLDARAAEQGVTPPR